MSDPTGAVDREKLAELVLGNMAVEDHEGNLARLEAAVHPLVDAARASFLQEVRPSATELARTGASRSAPRSPAVAGNWVPVMQSAGSRVSAVDQNVLHRSRC